MERLKLLLLEIWNGYKEKVVFTLVLSCLGILVGVIPSPLAQVRATVEKINTDHDAMMTSHDDMVHLLQLICIRQDRKNGEECLNKGGR